jgi:hypothetical protein
MSTRIKILEFIAPALLLLASPVVSLTCTAGKAIKQMKQMFSTKNAKYAFLNLWFERLVKTWS